MLKTENMNFAKPKTVSVTDIDANIDFAKSYAIQAGRELRIIANSESVRDSDAVMLSQDIAKSIEEKLTYPGQIRVTVIRETRAVEYAK